MKHNILIIAICSSLFYTSHAFLIRQPLITAIKSFPAKASLILHTPTAHFNTQNKQSSNKPHFTFDSLYDDIKKIERACTRLHSNDRKHLISYCMIVHMSHFGLTGIKESIDETTLTSDQKAVLFKELNHSYDAVKNLEKKIKEIIAIPQ